MAKKKRTVKGNPNKHYMITDARLEEIKDQMAEEATYRACMIMLGVLSQRGWTESDLLDLFDEFSRMNEFAIDGVLPCRDVQEIIKKHNGMSFESRWY